MTKETVKEIIEDIATNGSLDYDQIVITVTLKDNTYYIATCGDDFDSFLVVIEDALRLSINTYHDVYIDIDSIKCITNEISNKENDNEN